ncbi:MAG: hypothetical protein VZS44_04285 [Bacilli bacterium]|nr:hypothetical protein [Bacilli bacterium]
MRRIILFSIIFFLLLSGCNNRKEVRVEAKKIIDKEVVKDKYVDNNPIKLSLYVDKNKIANYKSPMTIYKDIVSLECYYTNDDKIIDGKFKDVFNSYYSKYRDIDKYKIGYYIKFSTVDGEISKYIYRPSDVDSFFNYIQVYLYDDIHQGDGYYDHISNEEYNDDMLLTSIKLTASMYIDKVSSDIEVSVFTYLASDIDDKGQYRGNSKYKVVISKEM